MPDIYEIKDPRDGSVFELQLDHPPTPEEARTAVAKYRVSTAKAAGGPMMGAAPPTRWQTLVTQLHDAMGPAPAKGEWSQNPIGPNARAMANTPLARPTGIDLVDSLTSPLSLGLSAVGMAGKAVGALKPAAAATVETVRAAGIGPEIKSLLLGHRGEKVAKIAEKLRDALAEAPSAAEPVASAPATPAPSAPTPGTSARPASTRPPARATPPAARMSTPVDPAMEEIGDRMAGGPDRPSPGNGTPAFDLNSLTPQEKIQALKWYEAGMKPEKILENIGISRKLTGSFKTPTPDEAATAVADRNTTGRWPE